MISCLMKRLFIASLKLTKNLEDIELEGFRVAENTAVKEEKKVITLTVAECMEFHSIQSTVV